MKKQRLVLIFLLFLFSCTSSGPGRTNSYVIRYVDLPKIYSFAVKYDAGVNPGDGEGIQDEAGKKKIYGKIKTAVSNVARRHDADFVLNTGEAVLYSRTAYDVTDDVIREYKKLSDITSPEIK